MKITGNLNLRALAVLLLTAILTACTNEPEGKSKDTIKLSEKEVQLPASESSYLVTTEGTWWWVNEIYFDEIRVDLGELDTTKSEFLIENPEFSIERVDATEIHIELKANETDMERELLIFLQAGNYADGIRILQSGQ